jgi:putative membrane protein
MKTLLCCAAGAALLALSAPAVAQTPPPPPVTAMPFVMAASSSDMFEIESSKLALQKSKNDKVRAFAQMMIDHHTMTTANLTQAAKEAGLAPMAPALDPMKQQKLDMLKSTPDAQFDAAYKKAPVMGHEEALNVMQTYNAKGDKAPLKAAAGKTAPIVQKHLGEARTLASSVGA